MAFKEFDLPEQVIVHDHVSRGRCGDERGGWECTRPEDHCGSHEGGQRAGDGVWRVAAKWEYI